MKDIFKSPRSRFATAALGTALLGLLAVGGCSDGEQGPPGPPGRPPMPPLQRGDDLPGFQVEIVAITGGSGPNGNFRPGDRMRVQFTVEDDDGETIPPDQWSRGAIMVSGPSFNYQRVVPILSDLAARSRQNPDGSFTYEFADPLPATYAEPYHYTGDFSAGVMAGEPLLDGTYTVAIEARRDVEVGDETVREADNPVAHFLVGSATAIDPREVVAEANCAQCHEEVRAHGDNRRDLTGCLLCHTVGAEDPNIPDVAGGTPGVTIDFRVMIHKIHTGSSLPSVLGMTTDTDGRRVYDIPGQPYQIVGFGNRVIDFSDVVWPRWPEAVQPMPRDRGHTFLDPAAQAKEDAQRRGPANCGICHGDPDGDGPAEAPAQGELIYSQQSRYACGSCHDDWVWDRPYRANGALMPPQTNEADCLLCHPALGGSPFSARDGHVHPLVNPDVVEGVRFEITSLTTSNGDERLETGERLRIGFTIRDADGNDVSPADLIRGELAISGPTANPQFVHYASLPLGAIGAGPTYEIDVPELIQLERAGASTAANGETFTTARAPHWTGPGVATTVWLRTGTGNSSTLSAAAPAWQNFVDVADGSQFMRNDIVAIADGGMGSTTEYMQVQWVDGNRLWFSAKNVTSYKAALRLDHPANATVAVATVAVQSEGTDYTLDPALGTITEIGEMGSGDVIVTYTSAWELPGVYTGTVNESPGLDSAWGEWLGLPVVAGTYEVGLWASRPFVVTPFGEPTSYTETAPAGQRSFLVGNASTIEEPQRISSAQNCYDCHGNLQFHGNGRLGYESCAFCHTVAGAEDRPRYVAPGAPETPDVTIDFRSMAHKIHHGMLLSKDYEVVGFGPPSAYPNNFSIHTYDEVVFPAWPGATANCATCHGDDNEAWQEPADRTHPDGQPVATRVWLVSCGSCHDSDSARAHMLTNQGGPGGSESCATCHGEGRQLSVERVHRTY